MLSYPEAIKLLYKEYSIILETKALTKKRDSLKRKNPLYLITKVANVTITKRILNTHKGTELRFWR
jgi:hypothetical protein